MQRTIAIVLCLMSLFLMPRIAVAEETTVLLAQSTPAIDRILIEGAKRIEPETIRSYLLIREGDGFDSSSIDRSLKSLFATGMFADVSFKQQGDDLIVTVIENPIINRIAFEGNTNVDDERIEPEVTLRPRVIYTRTKVQNDVKRILTLYRRLGRFAATVEPKVIQLEQNRIDLVFEINEGDPTEIRTIRFVGNREFDDDDLRGIVQTKESRWYRYLSSDDVYDPDRLTLDRELLRQFYLSEGYADFRVISAVAELTPDRKDFFVTFTVDEGDRYVFGDITVEARLRDLDGEALRDTIKQDTGDWYSSEQIEDTVDNLTQEVGVLGFAFVDVRPRLNRNRADKIVDVTYEINEGPRVFVERIDIIGNVRTVDHVIRREFRLVEGDAFNSAKLRRSRQRLQNLNFFESVKMTRLPGSTADQTTIQVEVEEKSTGSLSLGAGYSSDDGPLAEIGISERNLLGTGQQLALNIRYAAEASQINLSYTEPYFLDRDISAGFDVFRKLRDNQNQSSFDSKILGAGLRMGYPITENLSQNWKYTYTIQKIDNVDSDASIYVTAQEGEETLSEVAHMLLYDRRDSIASPTEGYYVRLNNDLAGLGGTTHYLRNTLKAGQYYPFSRGDYILGINGKVGLITGLSEDVNLLDRFFLGGSTLRGFQNSGVGPRDISTDDALGGEWMYTGSVEMKFPLGLPKELGINGRAFSDLGSTGKLSDSGSSIEDTGSVRMSAGLGFSWGSPFGPIGVDYGIPIVKEDFDKTENIRVNFGTRF